MLNDILVKTNRNKQPFEIMRDLREDFAQRSKSELHEIAIYLLLADTAGTIGSTVIERVVIEELKKRYAAHEEAIIDNVLFDERKGI